MAKFKFRNNNLKLEIEDSIFYVDIANFAQSDKLLQIADDALKIGKDGNTSENVEKLMKKVQDALDTILGEGATVEIFKDRKINLLDMLDVLAYITREISEFRSDKLQNVYSVNRKDELTN